MPDPYRRKAPRTSCPLLCLLLSALPLSADRFSFQWYNDFFSGTDQHFTNGVGLDWMDDTFHQRHEEGSGEYSALMYRLVDALPWTRMDPSKKHTAGIGLTQVMYTPADTSVEEPQYDDIPYVGYLGLSFYLFEWDDVHFTEYRIEGGVIGPESGAGRLQCAFHRMIGNSEPQGWDTQLGTYWTLNGLHRRGYKSWRHKGGSLDADWFNHIGFRVGNLIIDAFAGSYFRFGRNYAETFNVSYPYFREQAGLLHPYAAHHGVGWDVTLGFTGELMAYSKVIDEARKEGYEVARNTVSGVLYAGTSLYVDAQKVTFFYELQSPQNRNIEHPELFGGFKFSLQF